MVRESPLLLQLISAGFPSPENAEMTTETFNVHEMIVRNAAATFFMRVSGGSMQDMGIYEGDIVAVDRSVTPKNNDIVVAVLDGDFTLKKLKISKATYQLVPANKQFPTITVRDGQELLIWGVVTHSIRKLRK